MPQWCLAQIAAQSKHSITAATQMHTKLSNCSSQATVVHSSIVGYVPRKYISELHHVTSTILSMWGKKWLCPSL